MRSCISLCRSDSIIVFKSSASFQCDLNSSCVLVSEDSCELHRGLETTYDSSVFLLLQKVAHYHCAIKFPVEYKGTVFLNEVHKSFLLIVRTNRFSPFGTVGYSEFPAYSKIYLDNYDRHFHSYRRHSPGLTAVSSHLATLGTRCRRSMKYES